MRACSTFLSDYDQVLCRLGCGWHCQLVRLHPSVCGHCCLPVCEVVLPEGWKGNEKAGGHWSVLNSLYASMLLENSFTAQYYYAF